MSKKNHLPPLHGDVELASRMTLLEGGVGEMLWRKPPSPPCQMLQRLVTCHTIVQSWILSFICIYRWVSRMVYYLTHIRVAPLGLSMDICNHRRRPKAYQNSSTARENHGRGGRSDDVKIKKKDLLNPLCRPVQLTLGATGSTATRAIGLFQRQTQGCALSGHPYFFLRYNQYPSAVQPACLCVELGSCPCNLPLHPLDYKYSLLFWELC